MIEWIVEYIYLDDSKDSGYSYAISFAPTRARAAQVQFMLRRNGALVCGVYPLGKR